MDDPEKLIIATLDKIRHFLQKDGGDVIYESFKDGIVYVKMIGACQDCMYANSDIKDLVEVNSGTHENEKGLIEAIERERNRAEALRRSYVQKLTALRTKEAEVDETLTQLREFRKTKRDRLTEEYTSELRNKMREFEALISALKTTINNNSANANAAEELMNALNNARSAHASVKQTKAKLEEQQNNEEVNTRKAF